MNLLAWNCWGLGLPRTVHELVLLAHTYRPKLLFICETKTGEKKLKDLSWRLGLRKCITQVGKGKGSGIALYWDEQLEITVLSEGQRDRKSVVWERVFAVV